MKYIILSKLKLIAYGFETAFTAANFLWGKDLTEYLVIKDENTVVNLQDRVELSEIQKELEST